MLIFAWILWSYYLICLVLLLLTAIICNIKGQTYKIDILSILITIATFVFLTIYLVLNR